MRVSDSMRLDAITRQTSALSSRQLEAARQASSGSRIALPSDDPAAAAQVARLQASLDQTGAYRSGIRIAKGDVTLAESALASAGDLLSQVIDLGQQGANGSLSASDRASLATQIDGLKSELVRIANTKGSQGYIFGGTKIDTVPFDAAGTFLGDNADRVVELGQGVIATVSVSGANAFTAAGGVDVFAQLDALSAALSGNNPALAASTVNQLDAARRQIGVSRSDAGIKMARLDAADGVHEQTEIGLQSQMHSLVDADPAAAYSQLAAVQSSLDQAITVARKTLQTLDISRFG